jgi:hypothetical protein
MQRTIITLSLILVLSITSYAQKVVEGQYEFIKRISDKANGISLVLNGSEEAIDAILHKKFKAEGNAKVKNLRNGIMSAEAAQIPSISPSTFDYYYRLEPTGKKNEIKTRLTFFVSAGNYNFLSSKKFPSEMKATSQWLAQVAREVMLFQQELFIQQQENNVKKAEKYLSDLMSESKKLESMLAEIKAKLDENKQNQAITQEQLKGEKERLEKMQAYMYELKK